MKPKADADNNSAPAVCVYCGSADVTTHDFEDRVAFETPLGLGAATVTVPAVTCNTCGLSSTVAGSEEARDQQMSAARRVRIGHEIARIREQSGLKRSDWLSLTKIGDASLTRWETGANEPNAAYIQYLYLLNHPETLALIRQRDRMIELSAEAFAHRKDGRVECEPFPGSTFDPHTLKRAALFRPIAATELEAA